MRMKVELGKGLAERFEAEADASSAAGADKADHSAVVPHSLLAGEREPGTAESEDASRARRAVQHAPTRVDAARRATMVLWNIGVGFWCIWFDNQIGSSYRDFCPLPHNGPNQLGNCLTARSQI